MRRLTCFLLALFSLFALAAPAAAQPGQTRRMNVTLVAETEAVQPGSTLTLAFVMRPRAGWHGYWRNPGDAGAEPRVTWNLPEGWTAGPLQYPMPSPKTLLIIDDDDDLREALAEQLALHEEFRTLQASTAGDGVRMGRESRADLILLDVDLPDMDGVETTRALRAACPSSAVVALSAAADETAAAALLEAGAVACLMKDRELDEIVAAIRSAAGRSADAPT